MDSINAGVAYVPADRAERGLNPQDRLYEHVLLPRLGPLQRGVVRNDRAGRREAARWITTLDVQPPSLYRRMERFSGGNQQKAVLARWLRTAPRVLLLDEPTQGVDVGAKASIYRHVREVADRGTAVLVASSDAAELAHLCDRVLVFRSGTVATELRGAALTEERLIAETFGTTSHRGTMLVNREPIRVKVIRDDAEVETAAALDEAVATPVAVPPQRGMLRRVRELLGRLPRAVGGR